ncbi:Zinc finger BED domain-containing protein RICESLEEPER 3 [Linum perenne]
MGKVMMSKFKKYWEDYNSVLAFGVIMDPRYKLAFVKYCHGMLGVDYSFKWMDIQEELYLLFDEYKKVDTSQLLATTSTCLVTSEDPTAVSTLDFDSCEDDASRSGKSELEKYLEDPRYPRNELVNGVSQPVVLDVLEWWKEYEFRYPRLSRMARDILAIPITSVASESSFILGGRVLSKWRTCILSDTLEALMTTRNWLYGYKIEDEENAEDKGEEVSLT